MGILLLAVFTLELEMDYPSETRSKILYKKYDLSNVKICQISPRAGSEDLYFDLKIEKIQVN